jgi:hypothetical protein
MINTREIAEEYRLSHWARIMQERMESGSSIKEFCKQAGICQNTYFYWQRRVRAAACGHLVKSGPVEKRVTLQEFTEVVAIEPPAGLTAVETAPLLRIEFSGMQITAGSDYPVVQLAKLLRELAKRC